MKFRVAAGTVAVAALTAGATYGATSLAGSPATTTTIQACVKTENGDVRIVDGPAACHPDERSVTWNVQGPKGEQGDKGDTGATGPAGLSVQSAALAVGDPDCPFGGSKFTVGDAPPSFACNGARGADGKDGQDGKDGKDGATFASVDDLDGLACRASTGDGTTSVSVENGRVVISCNASSTGGGSGGGGTGVSCTPPADPPHGLAACDSNGNVVYGCSFGWVDTDANLANGCEGQLDLQNDPHNCGSPGHDVSSLPNAIGGCRNGMQYIAACKPGYSDLNGLVADGCELSGAACPHPDGLGDTYDACVALGQPGTEQTYSLQMAIAAAQAWNPGVAAESTQCGPVDFGVYSVKGTTSATWIYSGPLAGYVDLANTATPVCPTATDPTWR
jgi:hypothetical protein